MNDYKIILACFFVSIVSVAIYEVVRKTIQNIRIQKSIDNLMQEINKGYLVNGKIDVEKFVYTYRVYMIKYLYASYDADVIDFVLSQSNYNLFNNTASSFKVNMYATISNKYNQDSMKSFLLKYTEAELAEQLMDFYISAVLYIFKSAVLRAGLEVDNKVLKLFKSTSIYRRGSTGVLSSSSRSDSYVYNIVHVDHKDDDIYCYCKCIQTGKRKLIKETDMFPLFLLKDKTEKNV